MIELIRRVISRDHPSVNNLAYDIVLYLDVISQFICESRQKIHLYEEVFLLWEKRKKNTYDLPYFIKTYLIKDERRMEIHDKKR